MKIESDIFINNGRIPVKYTCNGEGINPSLIFKDVPKETKSLALIMDDPDIPEFVKSKNNIGVWDHWVVFNMSPETKKIDENSLPNGIVGKNTSGENKYGPPCPPDREHRYFFKLYALDTVLSIPQSSNKADLVRAMAQHIIDSATLVGLYGR